MLYMGFFIKNCTEWIQIHDLEHLYQKKATITENTQKNPLLLHAAAYLLHTGKNAAYRFIH